MRKENSTFKLNFLSQPGVQVLHNNDYYGCSELEDYACYVIADGLEDGNSKKEDPSARIAVEAAIAAFNENPSIRRGAIAKYLDAAHLALRNNESQSRYRASITIVVTNYQKLRYGYAGNCRFNLFRSGRLIEESKDHSLSWKMMEKGKLQKDKIAHHEERNNLDIYCGVKGAFHPTISKAIKLHDMDILSLYTRGVWENINTNDMMATVNSAENDPAEASLYLERLILDSVPAEGSVDNYTVCFVFVDKIYNDVEESKRKKKIIIFSIIAALLIIALVIALVIYNNRRAITRNDMELAQGNGITYIEGSNFLRAKDELELAIALADKLRDHGSKTDINNLKLLVEAILLADDHLSKGNYEEAIDAYNYAKEISESNGNLAQKYIEKNRINASDRLSVHEEIARGDYYLEFKAWKLAEECYLLAKRIATAIFYTEGRKMANDALDNLYNLMRIDKEKNVEPWVRATEHLMGGDSAFDNGNYEAAASLYHLAKASYEEAGDTALVELVDKKIADLNQMIAEKQTQLDDAAKNKKSGDDLINQGDYSGAKEKYILVRNIYTKLGEDEKLKEILAKIDNLDSLLSSSSPASASSSVAALADAEETPDTSNASSVPAAQESLPVSAPVASGSVATAPVSGESTPDEAAAAPAPAPPAGSSASETVKPAATTTPEAAKPQAATAPEAAKQQAAATTPGTSSTPATASSSAAVSTAPTAASGTPAAASTPTTASNDQSAASGTFDPKRLLPHNIFPTITPSKATDIEAATKPEAAKPAAKKDEKDEPEPEKPAAKTSAPETPETEKPDPIRLLPMKNLLPNKLITESNSD